MESVRRAVLADARAIAAVHRESRAAYYGDPPDLSDAREAIWEHLLEREGTVAYVVEDDGVIVAFMSARAVHSPEPALEMSALYVQPGLFGRGTGTRLHKVFESERGPKRAGLLEVWEGNDRAIEFYRHHGWVPTSITRPGPHGKPFVTYRLGGG
jgi:ribosomal protein S18 acetylase RimI-like enzyme